VAWHGDRERYALEDPTVVIVSTGQPRPFHLRPRGGGASRSWQLGHGDLFVMGGSCQHDWEHCVPKVAAAGPRLSIMFRHDLADVEVRD
jgi:alkylated DNA repair dioxygenase AlkB